jgi:hypothetical protein
MLKPDSPLATSLAFSKGMLNLPIRVGGLLRVLGRGSELMKKGTGSPQPPNPHCGPMPVARTPRRGERKRKDGRNDPIDHTRCDIYRIKLPVPLIQKGPHAEANWFASPPPKGGARNRIKWGGGNPPPQR